MLVSLESLVSITSPSFVCLHLHVFMIRYLPEAVYCCFTRTTLFTTMFTVIIVMYLLKSMCIPSFVLIGCCISKLHGHLCPYRNVLPEAVYCCFTRTTLFTTMFTVIIVMYLLKSMWR